MLSFLKNIYYFAAFNKLLFSLFIGYVYFKINNKMNDYLLDVIYNDISRSGIVSIKFTQWALSRISLLYPVKDNQPAWIDKFKNFYENCNIHSIKYTEKIFLEDFKMGINSFLEIIGDGPIASGSIGQVYKCRMKNNNTIVAMKVIHPDIKYQIIYPRFLIKTINKIFLKLNKLNQFFIPCDINDFFYSLEKQIDLNYEYNYANEFYNKYIDNDFVIIPKPICHSSRIMISEFEEGTFFEKLDITEYKKAKIAVLFILFIRQSFLIDGLIHADLHEGNWKVRKIDDNNYKIIIYDTGFCFRNSTSHSRKFWSSWELGDSITLTNSFIEAIKNKLTDEKKESIREELYNKIHCVLKKPLDISLLISKTTIFFIEKNILLTGSIINLFIVLVLLDDLVKRYGFISNDVNEHDMIGSANMQYKVTYLNLINFCNTNKCFTELSYYLKSIVKKNANFDNLFHNLEEVLNNNEGSHVFNQIDLKKKERESFNISI